MYLRVLNEKKTKQVSPLKYPLYLVGLKNAAKNKKNIWRICLAKDMQVPF